METNNIVQRVYTPKEKVHLWHCNTTKLHKEKDDENND